MPTPSTQGCPSALCPKCLPRRHWQLLQLSSTFGWLKALRIEALSLWLTMAPTAINLKIPCLVGGKNDPKFLYILHDGPPLKSPVPSGVRFARTMGAKFGSKGAATAGRTSKCFIAPTGIDMAEKISAKLKRIQEAQEVRVPKAQPARQNWSAEMLQNKDMLQFLLGLFRDQESPDWLLIWLSLPPHTEPPLKSSNMARAGRMANIVSERTDQWSQRLIDRKTTITSSQVLEHLPRIAQWIAETICWNIDSPGLANLLHLNKLWTSISNLLLRRLSFHTRYRIHPARNRKAPTHAVTTARTRDTPQHCICSAFNVRIGR